MYNVKLEPNSSSNCKSHVILAEDYIIICKKIKRILKQTIFIYNSII